MTTEEMISSVIKEVRARGGFQNMHDFELTMNRILSTKFDEARKDGAKEEREACAMICDNADKSTHPADLADKIRARSS